MNNAACCVDLRNFAAAVLLMAVWLGAVAVNNQPLTERWAPSAWQPDDVAGSSGRAAGGSPFPGCPRAAPSAFGGSPTTTSRSQPSSVESPPGSTDPDTSV